MRKSMHDTDLHSTPEKKQGAATRERLIAFLLTESSIIDAADKAGVGLSTAYRWLNEDAEFKQSYKQARDAVVQNAIGMLESGFARAVASLMHMCDNPDTPDYVRIQAASKVAEFNFRLKENKLEEMMNELEEHLAQNSIATYYTPAGRAALPPRADEAEL